jgi:hypothetical protein
MREHSSLRPHEISASVKPMGRFGCTEVANLPSRRRIKDHNLPWHPLSLRLFSGQCGLKLLSWNARSCPLLPRHLWSSRAVDTDELFTGWASCECEESNTLAAIGASRLVVWLRLRTSLDRPSLCLGLYFGCGPHLSASCLAGRCCFALFATGFGFVLPRLIFLFCHGFSSTYLVGAGVEP